MPAICPQFCIALGLQYPCLKGRVHMQWPNLEAVRKGGEQDKLEGRVSNLLSPWVSAGGTQQGQHLPLENGHTWVVQTLKTFTQHLHLETEVRNGAKPEQKLPGSWGKSYLESGRVLDHVPPQTSVSTHEGDKIHRKSKLCWRTNATLWSFFYKLSHTTLTGKLYFHWGPMTFLYVYPHFIK